VKLIQTTILAALFMLAVPLTANASLGGKFASVQADQAHLRGTLQSTLNSTYTVHELKAPTGLVVREYLSTSTGEVFAVTWQGPTKPDLQQVLGGYFQTFETALQSQKTSRLHGAPIMVNQPGLVVQMGCHMRFIVGRAYVPNMIPGNVQLEEIR
jgi:hypothetical protein